MGREIVYCWKCATRLQGADFDSAKAFRVGDQVSCPDCVEELVADLPAEQQEAILNPPKVKKSQSIKKISSTNIPSAQRSEGTSRRTGPVPRQRTGTTGPVPKVRTGQTGPIPTAQGTRVTKKITRPIPKVEPPSDDEEMEEDGEAPPTDDKKKKLILIGSIGGGVLVVAVIILVIVFGGKAPKQPLETAGTGPNDGKPKVVAPSAESAKEKEVKALLKEAFDLKQKQPDALGLQLKKFREAEKAAEGLKLLEDVTAAIDEVMAKLDKAIAVLDKQVEQAYAAGEFKAVLAVYEAAKPTQDVTEWQDRLDTKIKLVRNKVDDNFRRLKNEAKEAREGGDEDKVKGIKDQIAKWGMPDLAEKFDQFLATVTGTDPADPGKSPADPTKSAKSPKVKPLSPAMKSFFPVWQKALGLAQGRDYSGAATEMSGASKQAEGDEPKKAAADDAEAMQAIGLLYPEILKAAAQTPKGQALTLEYQDAPGVWKKVTGKTVKVEPTRIEFKPAAKDGKDQPAIFIEISDLNAGSLAELYKARKKPDAKENDLLARFCLIEGATEAAQTMGNAPDRYWLFATDARAQAPKPNSREFEARILFHQSEFEWRKSVTKYPAIEKSKVLITDYTSTAIVKKYQPQIAKRAETGKEFVYLPNDLQATGDYNVFKIAKKDDPAWVTTKGIDFKDSLFNYIEAEFVALPNLSYRCWVYAGGCCQEVWNGSYQASDGTTSNKGKTVSIDPGLPMAASLPMPSGLKKLHDDHKPKGAKEHPKTPARWDWISIPLPKTFAAPGAKQIRILTDQQGFGVKYIIISSTRQKAPDEATAKELAKDAAAAAGGGSGKSDVKGAPTPKDWLLIGPFAEALAAEQGPEKEIDLSKELPGKSGVVKWKTVTATVQGATASFDFEKGLVTPKDNVSVYALIFVKAPSAMDCKLIVSHDDGCKAWCGRQLVHNSDRTIAKDKEAVEELKLEEGWNRLLIKVRNNNAQYSLSMRITDAAKKEIPSLEYSPYGDQLDPQ
jgi:hypothetical protein